MNSLLRKLFNIKTNMEIITLGLFVCFFFFFNIEIITQGLDHSHVQNFLYILA